MGIYVGVDPGKEGFSVWIDADSGRFLGSAQQPLIGDKGDNFDVSSMVRQAREWKEQGVLLAVVEELQPMGGKMATPQTSFYQGMVFALWKAIFTSLEIPYRSVKKNHLKKIMDIKTPAKIPREKEPPKSATKAQKAEWKKRDRQRLAKWKKQVKAEAIRVATELFPGVDFRRNERCKNVDDNKAEGALYAVLASKMDHRG
jgi:hypothetical protein